ncbi:MAG: DUF3617 family protein [Hyphomonas sp.]|jgi:hypothetical protein|nr:DUF3617 family protein [Hyphomonas sp.]
MFRARGLNKATPAANLFRGVTLRLSFLLLPALLFAAPVSADPLQVAKGMWSTSTDMYVSLSTNGEAVDDASEHSALDECWSADEEVLIDESMADMFEGCAATRSRGNAYSFALDLACDFEGFPMNGAAEFMVNKARDMFSVHLLLSGDSDGSVMTAEGLIIGHRTGTCTAP